MTPDERHWIDEIEKSLESFVPNGDLVTMDNADLLAADLKVACKILHRQDSEIQACEKHCDVHCKCPSHGPTLVGGFGTTED